MAALDALLAEIASLCERTGRPFPAGPWCPDRPRLPGGSPPLEVAAALLKAIQAAWPGCGSDQPRGCAEIVLKTIHLGWAEAATLASCPALLWLRAAGSLGRRAELLDFLARFGPVLARPEHDAVARALLRQLRGLKMAKATRVLVGLQGRRWARDPEALPELVASLAMVARQAEEPRLLGWSAGQLAALLDGLHPAGSAASPLPPGLLAPLAVIASRTLLLPALRRLCRAMIATPPPADEASVLVGLFDNLTHFETDEEVVELVAAACAVLPRNPSLQATRARLARDRGADHETLMAILDPIDPAAPGYRPALSWLAGYFFHSGADQLARAYYERLETQTGLGPHDQQKLSHLRVRQPDQAPAGEVPAPRQGPRFDGSVFDEFAPCLAQLTALLNIPPHHEAGLGPQDLYCGCEAAAADFAQRLTQVPGLTLEQGFRLVHRLNLLAESAFSDPAHWLHAFPFPLGPAYGRVDPARCDALQRGVLLHVVALCDHLLGRERPLQGAPAQASLRLFLDLARLRCQAQLALHREEQASADLARLATDLGPMALDPMLRLRERCRLALGDLHDAQGLRHQMQYDAEALVLPMREWRAWLAEAGATAVAAIDDPSVPGAFETVAGSGAVRRHAHATLPVRLELAPLKGLRLCLSHVLIGPGAGILLPHPWHLAMGAYPWSRVGVLNRAAQGAVLVAPPAWERLDEPVLVLANMDATMHRNFYHWMVLILTRILWLDESGDLERRRLLIPQELSEWMCSSLDDLGLAQDRFLPYRQDQYLELADALVVSPLEFASPTLCERLRQRFWRAAGLDPDAPPAPDRLLYISRRGANRRPLADEDRIQSLAQSLGFEVVAPETLPLLDQVRLFASSRGVAGPPGAAFTNLLWMQAATRVLAIFKDDANLPTFVDLSLIRGQEHRWALGQTLPGFEMEAMVLAPFSVDLELVESQLGWCTGARD